MIIIKRCATAGEFEGRGSEEQSGAPGGKLDSPLEVPRLCRKPGQGIYETGHWREDFFWTSV